MPDPAQLLRILSGDTVFGLDVDSRIRQASNEMTARAMIELFNRCDEKDPDWQVHFAETLSGMTEGDPGILIGFDDGRAAGKTVGDDLGDPQANAETSEHYLRLRFSNEDAAYYQFPLFPLFHEPFIRCYSRKREGSVQHLRLELAGAGSLQCFIQGLRYNPHLNAVEESSRAIFAAAPSHGV